MDRNKKQRKAAAKGNEEEENKEQREEISENSSSIGVNSDDQNMCIDEEGDGGTSEVQSSAFGSLSSLDRALPGRNEEEIVSSTSTAAADSDGFLIETMSSSSPSVRYPRAEYSSASVFWVRELTTGDLHRNRRMLFLDKAFSKKIQGLLNPRENVYIGVHGIITDQQRSRKFGTVFKRYNNRYMLINGWGNFKKSSSDWLKVGVEVKVSAFRHQVHQDLWFVFEKTD